MTNQEQFLKIFYSRSNAKAKVLFGCIVASYHSNEFVPHECSLVLQQLDVTEEDQISHVQDYELVQAGEVVVVVGGKVEQVMLVLGVSCSFIVQLFVAETFGYLV